MIIKRCLDITMNKLIIAIIIIAIIGIGAFVFFGRSDQYPSIPPISQHRASMLLTSPSFENNGLIPAKFTCDGGDINPELYVQNVPDGAKSLALIMDDPDAPGRVFIHWLVWNIDPKTTIIKQESRPTGSVEGRTDFGRVGYGGPCPPSGTHRYFFKLYALDATLDLPAGSGKNELEKTMKGRVLAETELVGLYER